MWCFIKRILLLYHKRTFVYDSHLGSGKYTNKHRHSDVDLRVTTNTKKHHSFQITYPRAERTSKTVFPMVETVALLSESVIQSLQAQNRQVLCHFSAGSHKAGREDSSLFALEDMGNAVDTSAAEHWLDIRSNRVQDIIKSRLDTALGKGCDGVVPARLDAYAHDTGFEISAEQQLIYNRLIASEAHNRGLMVGLKNNLGQVKELVGDFDFAVNEQCFEVAECDLLTPFIVADKAVFNVEYLPLYQTDDSARTALCEDANDRKISTLVLSQELDDSLRFSCVEASIQ